MKEPAAFVITVFEPAPYIPVLSFPTTFIVPEFVILPWSCTILFPAESFTRRFVLGSLSRYPAAIPTLYKVPTGSSGFVGSFKFPVLESIGL